MLGDRDEEVGLHQAVVGVPPADQRLDPAHAAVPAADLGLEVKLQPALTDGVPELGAESQPARIELVVLGGVEGEAAA